MKFSLDIVGYGGYFTDKHIALEEAFQQAARFGYDAVCIFAHRPIGFPIDINQDRRRRQDLASELDLELGAVVCCTSFMERDHVPVYPQEKEILYVREAIRLAQDLSMKLSV